MLFVIKIRNQIDSLLAHQLANELYHVVLGDFVHDRSVLNFIEFFV